MAGRSRGLEASRAMRGAAAVVLAHSPSVARALEQVANQRRAEAAELFATEIAAQSDAGSVERTLALVTSGRAWDAMRSELGLGVKAAREQMAAMVRRLLRPV